MSFNTLIDIGVTHCFIARDIVEKLGLEPSVIPHIRTKMPDKDQVHSSSILIREIVFLKGHKMVMDLIIMDKLDFDVILSIDFLSKHEAEMNCRKKKVRFNMDNGKQSIFTESQILSMMINNIKAKKMLSKGVWHILVHLVQKLVKVVPGIKIL